MYGQASGIVESIAGVIGVFAVIAMRPILITCDMLKLINNFTC